MLMLYLGWLSNLALFIFCIELFSIAGHTLGSRQPRRTGSGRTAGCCLSMTDGRLLRTSPWTRMRAASKLALGRKQRMRVAGS